MTGTVQMQEGGVQGGCRGGAAPLELSNIRMPLFIAKTRLPSQKWLNRSSGVQRECPP
jgi:hypothetical protein